MVEYYIYKPESREAWKKSRGLGGSDAAAVLGCSPWQTSYDLYMRLTGHKTKEKKGAILEKGNTFEPMIRKEFAELFPQYKVMKPPKENWVFINRKRQWMTASLDGIVVDKETKEKGILEIKYHEIRGREDAEKWESGEIPQQYYAQLLHYHNVTGFPFAYLAAKLVYKKYDPKTKKSEVSHADLKIYKVVFEEVKDDCNFLLKSEEEFWENNIRVEKPPKVIVKF